MPKHTTIQFTMINQFACYLEYNDDNGLTSQEITQIDNFIDKHVKDNNAKYTTFSYGNDEYFGTCDITHIKGTVIDCIMTLWN